MTNRYFLPTLAVIGAILALVVVFWSQRTLPPAPILFPPPHSPYPHFIAGAGIIESSSQNISIGTPFNEIIDKIFVTEGNFVKKGDPILQLDLRAFEAKLKEAEASLQLAKVTQENLCKQFSFYERLKDRRAVSEEAYSNAQYACLQAKENVAVAEQTVLEAKVNIERSTIRAPIDGQILQVNSHVGEIAPIIPFISNQSTWLTAANGTLVLMGAVDPMQVRIDIDEDDAWRYSQGSRAMAFVRGNSTIRFPLKFLRVEPYVIPKSSFTGMTTERVDTRVLQVLYQFKRGDLPVYPGQILDIFIESEPIENFVRYEPSHTR
ncbi:MAG TPA: biotin/lipoyl-binding protein [Chlamydiales bacterium]|nr:biotin/lipoyl-binding protein [Chlamydiales bacterium]